MSTLSARQRANNPARATRKDSRTLILRLVYGPAADRRMPVFASPQDWADTIIRINELMSLTGWPQSYQQEILADMQRLNPKNARAAA